jgi:RHS repeat-associated protein
LYPEVVVRAALADSESSATGHVFVANTPEVFQHDADGNLTRDGRWVYTWDGENRLVSMETRSCLLYPEGSGVPGRKLEFMYDHMGRRARKRVYTWNGSGWTPGTETLFVYDGWNLVCELSAVSNQLSATRSYVWGLDLSGSEQGAGGVGGLLFIGNRSSVIGHYAAAYDGNGNVMSLLDMAGAGLAAAYEYGPFGELIRATGSAAESNPFRFSTKYQDEETGLLYYGYRYYQPVTGRWLSRDPIGESAEIFNQGSYGETNGATFQSNLYCFTANDGLDLADSDGRRIVNPHGGVEALRFRLPGWLPTWVFTCPKVIPAAVRAKNVFERINREYECCCKGRLVRLERYDGCLIGNPYATWQIAHRIAGCHFSSAGVDRRCLASANTFWELYELIRGDAKNVPFRDYIDDTLRDIAAVYEGYDSGGVRCDSRFVPSECKRRSGAGH